MARFGNINNENKKGPHPDYERNVAQAERFIYNVQGSLLPGMRVRIEDSHALKRAFLMISWQAPRHAPIGNYANPVFLHQSKTEYDREVERVFNQHMQRAKNWNDWKPKEPTHVDPRRITYPNVSALQNGTDDCVSLFSEGEALS